MSEAHAGAGLRRGICLAAALGWLVAAGCGGSGDDELQVTRQDSAGVEIVASSGGDRTLAWSFQADFTLGGKDTDAESFYRVGSTLVGADTLGRIHVLDLDAFRIVTFDDRGRFLFSAGRAGEGPGELGRPGGMAVGPDGTVVVTDFGRPSLPRFREGEALEGLILPFANPANTTLGWERDALVLERMEFAPEGTIQALYLLTSQGDSVPMARFQGGSARPVTFESCGISITAMGPIFEPTTPWAAGSAGVAYVPGAEYVVQLFRQGRLVRSVRRDLVPRTADEAAALASQGEGMRIGIGGGETRLCEAAEVVEQRGFAPVLPWVGQLALAPDGTLWIRRFEAAEGASGPIDLFDGSGAYLGTLPPEAPLPLAFLPDGRVLVKEVDEQTDIERVAVGSLAVSEAGGG